WGGRTVVERDGAPPEPAPIEEEAGAPRPGREARRRAEIEMIRHCEHRSQVARHLDALLEKRLRERETHAAEQRRDRAGLAKLDAGARRIPTRRDWRDAGRFDAEPLAAGRHAFDQRA